MKTTVENSIETTDQEPSIIINGSENLDTMKVFVRTTQGQKAVTKEAYDNWMINVSTLEEQLLLTLLWETGMRIGEARMLPTANLWGRVLHVQKNKIKYKCKTCGKVKASHTRKPAKTCGDYLEDYKPQFKDIEVSDTLHTLLKAWVDLGHSDFLPNGETYYKKLLKAIHPDLKAHMFRRGMGIYYQQKGASDKVIGSLLGHDGTQNVKFYSESVDSEANEFRRKVFAGVDTRKQSDISVDENKAITESLIRKVMVEELSKMNNITK